MVVGAVALGTSGIKGASATDSLTTQERSKRWILSGALRNFYDDNMFNTPARGALGSFGVEVNPGVSFNLPSQQTLVASSYDYTAKWFEARESGQFDQTHELDGKLEHHFSERYSLTLNENFRMSDEPSVGNAQNVIRGTQDAGNKRNYLSAEFSALMRPTFGWLVGCDVLWQDYDSIYYSSVLDLVRQSFHADARWFQTENTLFFAGYAAGLTHYTYPTYVQTVGGVFVDPSDKDNWLHRVYFGLRHDVSRRLEVSGRVGVDYTDYKVTTGEFSPYLDLSARYTYLPESTIRLGANIERYPAAETEALDQQILSLQLGINHRLTPRITVGAEIKYQLQDFNDRGGGSGSLSGYDNFYVLSTTAEYKIRENFYANMYYAWSQRVSGRRFAEAIDFSKNEIYWGVRITY